MLHVSEYHRESDTMFDFQCPGKPTPPGCPEVVSVTHNSATLSWSPPRNDGGSPITGYIVESKSTSSFTWTVCNIGVKVLEPHFTVRDLVEGMTYEFRVIAENKAGRSEESPVSKPVVVRETAGTCHVTVEPVLKDLPIPPPQLATKIKMWSVKTGGVW